MFAGTRVPVFLVAPAVAFGSVLVELPLDPDARPIEPLAAGDVAADVGFPFASVGVDPEAPAPPLMPPLEAQPPTTMAVASDAIVPIFILCRMCSPWFW